MCDRNDLCESEYFRNNGDSFVVRSVLHIRCWNVRGISQSKKKLQAAVLCSSQPELWLRLVEARSEEKCTKLGSKSTSRSDFGQNVLKKLKRWKALLFKNFCVIKLKRKNVKSACRLNQTVLVFGCKINFNSNNVSRL